MSAAYSLFILSVLLFVAVSFSLWFGPFHGLALTGAVYLLMPYGGGSRGR